jgi:hypothetical protein
VGDQPTGGDQVVDGGTGDAESLGDLNRVEELGGVGHGVRGRGVVAQGCSRMVRQVSVAAST